MSPDPCFMRRLLPHITSLKTKFIDKLWLRGQLNCTLNSHLISHIPIPRITTRIESNGHLTVSMQYGQSTPCPIWFYYHTPESWMTPEIDVHMTLRFYCSPAWIADILARSTGHGSALSQPSLPSSLSLSFNCCNYAENTTKPEGLKCPWNVQTPDQVKPLMIPFPGDFFRVWKWL